MNEYSIIATIILLIAISGVYLLLSKKMGTLIDATQKPFQPATNNMETEEDTLALLTSLLNQINAEIRGTEDNHVFAEFQGEHIVFQVVEPLRVRIFDSAWYSVSADDLDQLSVLKSAINRTNSSWPVTLFYTISKETNEVNVQSQRLIYLNTNIPDLKEYFLSEIKFLLFVHQVLYREMHEVRQENT